MPERLDEEEPTDWRAGRNAVYQLAALTIGVRRDCRRMSRDKDQWLEPLLFVRGRFGSCSLTDASLEFRWRRPTLRVR